MRVGCLVLAVLLAGCASDPAGPGPAASDPGDGSGSLATGQVDVVLRLPRDVHQDSYEFAFLLFTPDGRTLTGTAGTDAMAATTSAQVDGCQGSFATGDIHACGWDGAFNYPFFRVDGPYNGTWNLTVERVRDERLVFSDAGVDDPTASIPNCAYVSWTTGAASRIAELDLGLAFGTLLADWDTATATRLPDGRDDCA